MMIALREIVLIQVTGRLAERVPAKSDELCTYFPVGDENFNLSLFSKFLKRRKLRTTFACSQFTTKNAFW